MIPLRTEYSRLTSLRSKANLPRSFPIGVALCHRPANPRHRRNWALRTGRCHLSAEPPEELLVLLISHGQRTRRDAAPRRRRHAELGDEVAHLLHGAAGGGEVRVLVDRAGG